MAYEKMCQGKNMSDQKISNSRHCERSEAT